MNKRTHLLRDLVGYLHLKRLRIILHTILPQLMCIDQKSLGGY
jgi:hypothetical protein